MERITGSGLGSRSIQLICHDLSLFPSRWKRRCIEERRAGGPKCMDGVKRRRKPSLRTAPEWYIPSTNSSTWKVHHFQEDYYFFFLGKHQLCRQQERRRVKRGKRWEGGGGESFLRHVSLICSPAANENDDLQEGFFLFCFFSPPPSLGSASAPAKTTQLEPHSEQV